MNFNFKILISTSRCLRGNGWETSNAAGICAKVRWRKCLLKATQNKNSFQHAVGWQPSAHFFLNGRKESTPFAINPKKQTLNDELHPHSQAQLKAHHHPYPLPQDIDGGEPTDWTKRSPVEACIPREVS